MEAKVYQTIASAIQARDNCEKSDNKEWLDKWNQLIFQIEQEILPNGSGFDSGTTISDKTTADRVVLESAYHHMNENGMYDGWTNMTVTVSPDLVNGFYFRINYHGELPRKYSHSKDYIEQIFHDALDLEIEYQFDDTIKHDKSSYRWLIVAG